MLQNKGQLPADGRTGMQASWFIYTERRVLQRPWPAQSTDPHTPMRRSRRQPAHALQPPRRLLTSLISDKSQKHCRTCKERSARGRGLGSDRAVGSGDRELGFRVHKAFVYCRETIRTRLLAFRAFTGPSPEACAMLAALSLSSPSTLAF